MTSVLGISLPETWAASPLKHVTTLLNRGSAPTYVDGGSVRAISQAANQDGGLDWSRTRFHDFEGDARKLKGHLLPDDILINSTGTGTLGRVGYFTGSSDGIPCMADSHVTIARTKIDELHPRFAYYWFKSQSFQDYVHAALVVGATNQIELNRDRLGDAQVPVPPLGEQRRIADFLDAETARIDVLVRAARRGRKLLDERRWATVHAGVTGEGDTGAKKDATLGWAKGVPERWPVVPLKWVASLGSGHTPSRSKPEYWEDCTIPWISLFDVGRMRDVRQEQLTETVQKISELGMENSSACLHPAGTVVLSRTASVGFSTVMGVSMAVSQHFVTWTCGDSLLPGYLLQVLRAMRQYFESVQVGTTNVTVFMPDLNAIKIPLPPISEQAAIVSEMHAVTERIDALAENFDRQIALLAERRTALITAAVTGQIDVSTASGRGVEE